MVLEEVWRMLQDEVFPLASTDRLFNQYGDRDEVLDLPDAPQIRRDNLKAYLSAYNVFPGILLIAEAPGPWGCRFSGVPITSESQLLDSGFPIHGARSSATGDPNSEYCANIHWRVLMPFFPHFLTWNAVPFHPHREDPLSIRTPTWREIDAFSDVVKCFVDVIRPTHVVAVGRKAERSLELIGVDHAYVRHPSQGGAKLFEEGVTSVLTEAGVPAGNQHE
jgi:hypothetical protein